MHWTIIEASKAADYAAAFELFKEYVASLDFDLGFQNIDHELTILPTMYGPPRGRLFLVKVEEGFVGCAALRQIENETTCELKRMYLRPDFRGLGIGKAFMEKSITVARQLGYTTMKLDTIGYKMPWAVGLYKSYGFRETTAYNHNPHAGVLYFERQLN
ncbi:GNAT family N-acetyltransferase [Persicitalea jodogahamensis]|uniref:N-acetyltransferase n=1 Tax=Persicitalea jodogahamensis TaxID=402147 RepID=A0A8J3D511_9BACT|nr:GNAT family N-acetyltransferase [Persicitalea jodogahamensis]GHB60812.1 N-acetyltransferase [Persicitalea jodogahamensis]